MKSEKAYVLLPIMAALAFLAVSASAQDTQNAVQSAAAPVNEQVAKTMAAEDLSIYGEVQSVNAAGIGSLTVQYYDYDSDDEKTITVVLDANTKLENANSIADIKKGDWADVTYSAVGGKNAAKSVIVEKEEGAAATPAAPEQAAIQEQTAVQGQAAVAVKEEASPSADVSY
ncbi:MAG: hypothetical protein NTZ95_07285 [Candidatus Omnitrophica bacterium]|nr:hypothetical protein [Candidatus Omnitrophota bacterium]